jgi:hypothetical protein
MVDRSSDERVPTIQHCDSARAGDVGSAALVWVGTSVALGVQDFAVVNLIIGLAWLWLVVRLARRHHALGGAHLPAP